MTKVSVALFLGWMVAAPAMASEPVDLLLMNPMEIEVELEDLLETEELEKVRAQVGLPTPTPQSAEATEVSKPTPTA